MAKTTKLHVTPAFDPGPTRKPHTPHPDLVRLGMEFVSNADADQALYESWFPEDPDTAQRIGPRFKELIYQIIGASADLGDDTPLFMERLKDFIEEKFPRQSPSRPTLPKRAPTLWKDRDRNDETNPALFTRGTYEQWLGHGLTRQHLRELDADLYRALSVWEHRHPEDRITELPTLAEVIDARIAALADEFSPDELRKLGSTLQTRHQRSKK